MPSATADRQRELNAWTKRYLRNVAPLRVDGKAGKLTNSRIRSVKYYLGYGKRGSEWNSAFVRKLRHSHSLRYSPPWQLALAFRRRRRQRALAARNNAPAAGKAFYDGRPVAAWMVPYMDFARHYQGPGRAWEGVLVSGLRDPVYSEHLCLAMCGAPRCPGRCAGRSSHHAQSVKPNGAIDVTDYIRFGEIMERCPLKPPIFNALPTDRVHFSAQGN